MHKEFSVAMEESTRRALARHLIRRDKQEDLCFVLWNPSVGSRRVTALLKEIILPERGDRQRHGNVSFNAKYLQRVCEIALEKKCGIAFLHSHPGVGWQGMSPDDIAAEQKISGAVQSITGFPLVGMTVSSDDIWSARFWESSSRKDHTRKWCRSVRSVGENLKVDFADCVVEPPQYGEMFKRTRAVWGKGNHSILARLRIGVVGLGSVGSVVAEMLARSGLKNIVLIDYDEIQAHNLDRILTGTKKDIGKLKVIAAKARLKSVSTADKITVEAVPFSVAEKRGYDAALNCDVLFSCVDRPRPRQILNHFAYAHLIPVIDGGIAVRFKRQKFSGVDWQLQTVAPGRPCLECLGSFSSSDAATEAAGKLDDPTYMSGLKDSHIFKRNENVFAFSANLASLEMMHLIALVTGIAGISNFGVQRFRYNPGIIDTIEREFCSPHCIVKELVAAGDRDFLLWGEDLGANAARNRQQNRTPSGD